MDNHGYMSWYSSQSVFDGFALNCQVLCKAITIHSNDDIIAFYRQNHMDFVTHLIIKLNKGVITSFTCQRFFLKLELSLFTLNI